MYAAVPGTSLLFGGFEVACHVHDPHSPERILITCCIWILIRMFVNQITSMCQKCASLQALKLWERCNTGLSKKMDGIWNRYNLKSTGRIYTFGVLKCSEKFKVLDLP